MPADPENPGGQGGDAPPTRSDLRLQARAFREDWPMAPSARIEILRRAGELIEEGEGHFPRDDRVRVAAMRVLLAAAGLNVRQQALDLAREAHELNRELRLAELGMRREAHQVDLEIRREELDRRRALRQKAERLEGGDDGDFEVRFGPPAGGDPDADD